MKRPKETDYHIEIGPESYINDVELYIGHLESLVAELQAKIVMLESNTLDGDHTGDYRVLPRRCNDCASCNPSCGREEV